ncbi:DUF2244 domain-containing protein [Donghicola sp. C2-DW-16]|uniref:DUF2244 domain-containing protein n=1 Tax=Donghicola mangrovi TaxID=2729614 RepID=A0ABX2PEH5_9RHOB|nr:DUF2244 domain-containing protein [Donghicola mangrovi]NVO27336.1 DUF2244 domain-containing protein [Donghicola mangrovi]
MPYEWVKSLPDVPEDGSDPVAELHLWPYRSLPRKGFVAFFAITSLFIALPLVAVIGSKVLWGLLPFIVLVMGLMWYMLERSYRDGDVIETLTLWPDRIHLLRRDQKGKTHTWECNIYWAKVSLYPTGGPVPNYVTLKGNSREVEIGAFLSEDERKELHSELVLALPRAARKQ